MAPSLTTEMLVSKGIASAIQCGMDYCCRGESSGELGESDGGNHDCGVTDRYVCMSILLSLR